MEYDHFSVNPFLQPSGFVGGKNKRRGRVSVHAPTERNVADDRGSKRHTDDGGW